MSSVSYTAVILDEKSKADLLSRIPFPKNWTLFAHHFTINLGAAATGPAVALLGREAKMTVVSVASDDRVLAVKIETDVPSTNNTKHITVAVNKIAGGKPSQSNNLTNWEPIPAFVVTGMIAEVTHDGRVLTA